MLNPFCECGNDIPNHKLNMSFEEYEKISSGEIYVQNASCPVVESIYEVVERNDKYILTRLKLDGKRKSNR